ncbi:MAG: hypothetical protein LJF04_01800 [Gemmatimonadetes bacterium]|nr:hypothetical protein [Gemmatimonadota bacterium]
MRPRSWAAILALTLASLPLAGEGACGQDLAARVAAAVKSGNGTVRFHFDAKPEVEVCDQGIRMGEHSYLQWRAHGWDDEPTNCTSGFLEVELATRGSGIDDVKILNRRSDRTADAVDLGEVPAPAAAHYLLSVARGDASGRAAEHAMLPAVLADAGEIWPGLMEIAKDRSIDSGVRRSALFWIGQAAGDVVAKDLREVATENDEDQDIRDAAVFALSQRPPDEGVPALMDLARSAGQAKTRRTAMFWLAQSKDPRVLPFFREILVGGGKG